MLKGKEKDSLIQDKHGAMIGCELRKDEGVRVYKDNNMGTLRANSTFNGDKAVMNKNTIRRLTPTECERLQGFPDNWTKYGHENQEISDTQRYKICGNAVSVPVVQAIGERL